MEFKELTAEQQLSLLMNYQVQMIYKAQTSASLSEAAKALIIKDLTEGLRNLAECLYGKTS